MVDKQEIREFVFSDFYNSILEKIKKMGGLDINKEDLPELLFELDEKKIKASGFSISEIIFHISENKERFAQYTTKKLVFFKNDNDQEGQVEKDFILKTLPFYRNFLVLHMIEFCIILIRKNDIERYTKEIRIPYSKKYSKQIKDIFLSTIDPLQ